MTVRSELTNRMGFPIPLARPSQSYESQNGTRNQAFAVAAPDGALLTAACRSAIAKVRRAAPTGWEKGEEKTGKRFTRGASSW